MPRTTTEPTTAIEKVDRCADLPHRPRVLLGKLGLDGHDRGVKLIARLMRDSGIHVIYSGLWQTAKSLAISARDEDVDCIALSMMSNSHLVLVPRLLEALKAAGRGDIAVNVGGIIPQEDVKTLLDAGVNAVFHTGTGLEEIVESVRGCVKKHQELAPSGSRDSQAALARRISLAHGGQLSEGTALSRPNLIVGITGAPGAGKSTLVAALGAEAARRGRRVAVVAFDPMSPITSGALLGDRLRVDFNTLGDTLYYRSLAIVGEDYRSLPTISGLIGAAGYDTLIVETVGAGQNDVAIRNHVDRTAVVVVPGMGDSVQMDKAGILEIANLFVANKADHAGEAQLVKELLDIAAGRPIFETVATEGKGIDALYDALIEQRGASTEQRGAEHA